MRRSFWALGIVLSVGAAPLVAQEPAEAPASAPRISVTWTEVPIRDVLQAFALFSGKSIVSGTGVAGTVTADINDQPWDVALQAILSTRGLIGVENEHGIIRIDNIVDLDAEDAIAPIETRTYRISYVSAAEIQTVVTGLLTDRGSVSVSPSTNTVVVSDIARVHGVVARLLRGPRRP